MLAEALVVIDECVAGKSLIVARCSIEVAQLVFHSRRIVAVDTCL